jgi:hypothetical protein
MTAAVALYEVGVQARAAVELSLVRDLKAVTTSGPGPPDVAAGAPDGYLRRGISRGDSA